MKKRSALWLLILCLCVSMMAFTVSADETAAPDAPTVTATNVAASGKIRLDWNAVEGAVKYEFYRSETQTGDYTYLTRTTKTYVANTSAVAGVKYYYYVVAVTADGIKSEKSNIVNRTCDLARPTLTLTNVASTGKVKVSWTAVDGAVKYQVYRSTDGGKNYSSLTSTTKTSITNTSSEAGKTYHYKVRAVAANSNATSAWSSAVKRTCDLAQPKLTVSNIASSGKIKLSWGKIDGALKYRVYVSQDKATWTTLKTTTGTTLNHSSAVAGQTYYYKVRALAETSSANSADSAVKIRACDLPRPVLRMETNGEAASGDYDITLYWTASDKAVRYEVGCSVDGGKTYETLEAPYGNQGRFEHYYAERGNAYSYRVRAIAEDSAANSAWAYAKAVCPLATPDISITLSSSGKPVIDWQKISGVSKYEVYYSTDYGENYSLLKAVTSDKLTHSSAKQNRTYCYYVKAIPANDGVKATETDMVFINCSCLSMSGSELEYAFEARLNQYREYYGLDTLSWNEWAEDGARIRAAELTKSYSVDRPNGDSSEELWSVYGIAFELDFQVTANVSASDVVDALMADEEIAGMLMSEDWTYVVAASNGSYWTVMLT